MSSTWRSIVPMKAATMRGVALIPIVGCKPVMEWVAPGDLYVEQDYQRALSERSIALIRRIAGNFRWAHVKPAICARVEGKLVVIDGQHTATAAATRGDVPAIPVMIVEAVEVRDRAMAFIGQNRDRLALTALHMHHAAVAGGDEIAVAVNDAVKRAGVMILRYQTGSKAATYKVGQTTAIGIISILVRRHGVTAAAKVLKVLVEAKRAPLPATEIAAVALILGDKARPVDVFDLATLIRSKPVVQWAALAAAGAARGGTHREALANVWRHELARRAR